MARSVPSVPSLAQELARAHVQEARGRYIAYLNLLSHLRLNTHILRMRDRYPQGVNAVLDEIEWQTHRAKDSLDMAELDYKLQKLLDA